MRDACLRFTISLVLPVTSTLSAMTRLLLGGLKASEWVGLGFVLAVLIGVAGGSLHWSFDLAAQFLLPAIIVAGGATLVDAVGRWPVAAGSGVVAVVAAYLAAMPFTTAPAPVAKDAARFKVLLFNVWFRNGRMDDVRKMVEAENPDLVVFVETTQRIARELQPLSALYP